MATFARSTIIQWHILKQLPSLGCAQHLLLDPLHLHYSQVFENMSKFIVDLSIYFFNSISPTVPSGRGLALTLHIRAWTKPKILWSAGITSTTSGSASVSSSRYLSFISQVECMYYSFYSWRRRIQWRRIVCNWRRQMSVCPPRAENFLCIEKISFQILETGRIRGSNSFHEGSICL